jgi:hypothetical protein
MVIRATNRGDKVPMLMVNGTLDTETPIDIPLVASTPFNGPHQTFVKLPRPERGTATVLSPRPSS